MAEKEIVIFYLDNINNFGEDFLGICTQYLVSQNKNVKVSFASLERNSSFLQHCKFADRLYKFLLRKSRRYCHFLYKKLFSLGYGENIRKALEGKDGAIIAAGSFKYETQTLWMDYSLIVQFASATNVPVCFSAMNIQPFSSSDWRARYLKEHLNNPIVKMMTTRDGLPGIKALESEYVINKNLMLDWVGDSAFCIKEAYKKERKKTNCVGINLLAAGQFLLYGGSIKEDEVIDFYAEVITMLRKCNIQFECFTNGMSYDEKTYVKICSALGCSPDDIPLKVPKSDEELVGMISSYSVILGARMHACVCAYAMDVPFVGFVWDKKLSSFAKLTNTENQFLSETEFSAENAFEKIKTSFNLSYDIQLRNQLIQRSKDSFKKFINCIENK